MQFTIEENGRGRIISNKVCPWRNVKAVGLLEAVLAIVKANTVHLEILRL